MEATQVESRKVEKAKTARVVHAQKRERSPLPSLLEAHRLRVRKTGKRAGITFWDPAREDSSAITGIHQYADTGARALALMIKSAHSSTEKNLSESARRKPRRLPRLG